MATLNERDSRGSPLNGAGDFFELPAESRKKVVSVKMEETLIYELDRLWRSLGYSSRSEFIREAIVYYMMIVRAVRQSGLCLCECNQPGAKSLEDILAESVSAGIGEAADEDEDEV